MAGYLVRRVLQAVVVLLIVAMVVSLLTHLVPGGEARAVLGPRATTIAINRFNQINGLDLPLWDQYWHLIDGYVHFQFGYSFKFNEPVGSLIEQRLPKTLLLVGLAVLLALVVAVPLGVVQVARRNRLADYVGTGIALIFYSTPTFVLGPVLIVLFALRLRWFSFEAPQSASVLGILESPRGLVLPVLSLSLISIAAYSRFVRSSMVDAMTQDYVRTARAKGAGESRTLVLHALRNALLPLATLIGLTVPALFSGAFIVESVFNYPGMGQLGINAIFDDDLPTLIGTVVVATIATVVGSLVADVLYAVLDPRISYG